MAVSSRIWKGSSVSRTCNGSTWAAIGSRTSRRWPASRALRYLDLSNNRIKDLSPLAGLTQLTELLLDGNQIDDVAPLGPLSDLRG